jgi:hypothetical protein
MEYSNAMNEFLKINDNSKFLKFNKSIPEDYNLRYEEPTEGNDNNFTTQTLQITDNDTMDTSALIDSLLETTTNLNMAVNIEFSNLLETEHFAVAEDLNQHKKSDSGKRKRDEEDVSGEFNKTKIRPRYKKTMVEDSLTTEQVVNYRNPLVTVSSAEDISSYFTNEFTPYLMKFENNEINANRFTDHITQTGYYMFIVKSCLTKPFEIVFAKYCNDTTREYTKNYFTVDSRVFVVHYFNVRFMISYNLVKNCEIEIPPSHEMCTDDEVVMGKCFFTHVYSHNFLSDLNAYFDLDLYFGHTFSITFMQAIGEAKSGFLLTTLYNMYKDKSLFTLPIMLSRNDNLTEPVSQNNNFVVSPYIQQILRLSEGLRFKSHNLNRISMSELKELIFQKNSLTFKYSSVANLFYDKTAVLKKVKKEDGSLHIVEQYLSENENNSESHNFIVLTFKNDERLTIVKKENEYFWIFGELKNINVSQIIQKFNKFTHHLFVISKVNRRESNTTHNHLLKLVALIVQNHITVGEGVNFSERNLNCKYQSIVLINNF